MPRLGRLIGVGVEAVAVASLPTGRAIRPLGRLLGGRVRDGVETGRAVSSSTVGSTRRDAVADFVGNLSASTSTLMDFFGSTSGDISGGRGLMASAATAGTSMLLGISGRETRPSANPFLIKYGIPCIATIRTTNKIQSIDTNTPEGVISVG